MSASARPGTSSCRPALGSWIRLCASTALPMAIAGVAFAGRSIRDPSVAGFDGALAAFVLAQVVLLPLERWLLGRRERALLLAAGSALLAVCLLATLPAAEERTRVGAYAAAGVSAALLFAPTLGEALRSWAQHRALCVAVTVACCAAASGVQVSACDAWMPGAARALALASGAEAAIVVLGALFVVYPPPPGPFTTG